MASQGLITEEEGKMDETTEYNRRMRSIAKKRKLQEEIDQKRRELDEERLKLQQLKRKSLRDRWLMETTSPSPLEPDPNSPVEQSQAYLHHLQQQLASLQSQMGYQESPTLESAEPMRARAQSLDNSLQQSTVTDTSANLPTHKSVELSDNGADSTLRPQHGDTAQEKVLIAEANGVMANNVEKEATAEVSLNDVEIPPNSVFHGSGGERVDSLHLEATPENKMEKHRDHREEGQMENGLEVEASEINTEMIPEEHNSDVLNPNPPEICLDRLMESQMVSECATAVSEGKTCTVDEDSDSTMAHQLAEMKAGNGYINLESKGAILAPAEPGSGLGRVLRARRVMIREDGKEVLVKALKGYVSKKVSQHMKRPEELLNRHTKGAGSSHLGMMKHDSDKTQQTFKGVDHDQAFQEVTDVRLRQGIGSQGDLQVDESTLTGQALEIPGKITTFLEEKLSTVGQTPAISIVSEDQANIVVEEKMISLMRHIGELPEQILAAPEQLPSIQEQIPMLNASVQEPMSSIQESIQEHISDLQASIQGQIPSLQASIQQPISNLEESIQGQIPRLHVSIQEPMSDLQASVQGQIPHLQAPIQEPISNLQVSIQGQIPNLQASIQEPISRLQTSIQDPISTLQSSIHGQLPSLQPCIQEPISNLEVFIQGQIPSLQASIQEPIANLQTSIQGQIPNLQVPMQEPISTIKSSIQEQVQNLHESIQEPISNLTVSIQEELPSLQASMQEPIRSVESTIQGQISNLQATVQEPISGLQASIKEQIPSLQASIQEPILDMHATIKGEMPSLETSIQGQIPSLQASIQKPINNLQTSIEEQIQNLQSSIQEPISSVQSSIPGLVPNTQESVQVQASGLTEGHFLQNLTEDFGQTFTTTHVSKNMSPEEQPLLEEVNLSGLPGPSSPHSLQLSTTPKDALGKPLNTKTQEGPLSTADTAQAGAHRSTDTQVDSVKQNRRKEKTCKCCLIM